MNLKNLEETLKKAKEQGFLEYRFEEYKVDEKYWFRNELASGYEISNIEYPGNDKGTDMAFPRIRFKFNESMKKFLDERISVARKRETLLEQLSKLPEYHCFGNKREI